MKDALDIAADEIRAARAGATTPEPAPVSEPELESADPLDAAVESVKAEREQKTAFASYLHEANDQTPDQAFEVLHLSAASGRPPQYVAEHRDEVKKSVDATALRLELATNPVLRDYLQDPSKLRVLSKDWEKASWLTRYVTGQFMHGLKQVTYGRSPASTPPGSCRRAE
jgi:hypothetical protein